METTVHTVTGVIQTNINDNITLNRILKIFEPIFKKMQYEHNIY